MAECNEINTFVVFDLETNGLPSEQFNTCSITEISLYAFSAKHLKERELNTKVLLNDIPVEDGVESFDSMPPELPRVLQKLTLMVNPRRMINPTAEKVTGLSNEMLENEASFNKTTADCLNNFLDRLHKPICMVAHNGWKFDFPILRYVYEKIKMSIPSSIYCIDSFKAFREIDEKIINIDEQKTVLNILVEDDKELQKYEQHNILKERSQQQEPEEEEIHLTNILSSEDPLEENSQINWQHDNETTPQRKKTEKRNYQTLKKEEEDCNVMPLNEVVSPAKKQLISLTVRRTLFSDHFQPKTKYPPKGVYKLGNIYRRCFKKEPLNIHRAECDVEILTKLILYYGLDFLAYAEERKQTFDKVPKLGQNCN